MTRAAAAAAALALITVLVSAGAAPLPTFTDITREAGLAFRHISGASAEKHLVETMGSGGLFFDYDGDGWLDVFLVDGGSLADAALARRARHHLYRNLGDGTFADVTGRANIAHPAYGMGACAGDYDGDRRPDLYVTSFGPNALYRNRGDGTFADVTAAARVGDTRFGASCAFADLDRDGDLDLWVVNYVDADRAHSPYCGSAQQGLRFYCHPLKYDPLPSTVYRNDGGTFTNVSQASGVAALRSNGLGVVIADTDDDGWPEVFVANDTMPNFRFRTTGGMRFEETALVSGVALAADGTARAGMGIDTGDYDGDGRLDLVITNLDFEMFTVHRGLDRGLFAYTAIESGVGYPTLPFVGFGVAFLDYDNDGRLDIASANGHILDNAPRFRAGSTYRQRKLLFRNTTGRRFAEVGRSAGTAFAAERVGRGLATGDIDNDGDLDLLVTNNGDTAELLRNDGPTGHALLIQLRGPSGNPDGVGARVQVTAAGRTQMREVKAGSSYLSQSDLRAHFGLGAATQVERVDIRWNTGTTDTVANVAVDHILTIEHERGVVARVPFVDAGRTNAGALNAIHSALHEGTTMRAACGLLCGLLAWTASPAAHHSFAAEYDGGRPVTVTGTVARVDWQNPHIYLYVDVKDENGAVSQWKFEGYPPNMLVRQGWKRDATLKVGDTITVFGWRARLDPHQGAAREVTFTDGRKLAAGPPAGTGGQ